MYSSVSKKIMIVLFINELDSVFRRPVSHVMSPHSSYRYHCTSRIASLKLSLVMATQQRRHIIGSLFRS